LQVTKFEERYGQQLPRFLGVGCIEGADYLLTPVVLDQIEGDAAAD
jgi:hypothetical protein